MGKRVALLTGGGDCPGLNAVIRAVTRRSLDRGYEVVGVREGWRGLVDGKFQPLDDRGDLGDPPARRHDPRDDAHEPVQDRRRGRARARALRRGTPRRARRHRRRGHARRRLAALRGARLPGRRRPQDDRQRPLGDRLHLRLRHGADRRHRGDRPPAHDRRVAQPRHGRRGHGPPHGLDRGDERHGRRRRRHPHPRAPDHDRGGLRGHPAPARARQGLLHRRRQRGLRAHLRLGRGRSRSPRRRPPPTSSATSGWAGSATCSPARSRSAPATRPASPSSATSSAAARRPRATASSPPATGSRRPTSSTRSAGARWPRSTATTIVDVPLHDAVAELKTVPPEFYEAAKTFFG